MINSYHTTPSPYTAAKPNFRGYALYEDRLTATPDRIQATKAIGKGTSMVKRIVFLNNAKEAAEVNLKVNTSFGLDIDPEKNRIFLEKMAKLPLTVTDERQFPGYPAPPEGIQPHETILTAFSEDETASVILPARLFDLVLLPN